MRREARKEEWEGLLIISDSWLGQWASSTREARKNGRLNALPKRLDRHALEGGADLQRSDGSFCLKVHTAVSATAEYKRA